MNKILNKLDLAKNTADLVDLPQITTKKVIDKFWEIMTEKLLEGSQISIAGFGNFSVKDRAARAGRNPRTGEAITIAAAKSITFKASSLLKQALKESSK